MGVEASEVKTIEQSSRVKVLFNNQESTILHWYPRYIHLLKKDRQYTISE
jgi:hypothetical protein